MKKNPYEVLGLHDNATLDEVKQAYKVLARKYQSDEYIGSPLSDVAQQKMKDIDEAYDTIVNSLGSSRNNTSDNNGNYYYSSSQYTDVRSLLSRNRLEEAETILDGVNEGTRDAEWYFLKGQIHQRRGWFDEANKCYSKACTMDPSNREYADAFASLNNGASGGYRTSRYGKADDGNCGMCDICSGLICADCCCEAMGGDLIRCC